MRISVVLAGTNKLGTIISIKQMQINRAGIRQTKSKQQTVWLRCRAKVKEMRLDYKSGNGYIGLNSNRFGCLFCLPVELQII